MREQVTAGLTHDFLTPDGKLPYRDIGLTQLEAEPNVAFRFMPPHEMTLRAEDIRDYDAIVSLAPKYTRDTFAGAGRLTVIARFGVGYDVVDVAACTEADVVLCTSRGAVDHSMAEAIVAWMLALSYRVPAKDALLRAGRWEEKLDFMGGEIRGRQLGVIGLGGVGRTLVQKLSGFRMKRPIVFDPWLDPTAAATQGVECVSLDELLRRSDFVAVCCPLNEQTRYLLNRQNLPLMKPEAFLINAARGGIVEEAALREALTAGRLAGAALDVFEQQPVGQNHPLAGLENVILAPHCIGWTHEMFAEIGRLACGAVVQVARGEIPLHVVNPEVLERPGFRRKLERFRRG